MKKALALVILALMAIATLQLWMNDERTGQNNAMDSLDQQEDSAIGGQFSLNDQDGRVVNDSELRGRLMLVTFGFTHCPDICPVTVSTFSKTMELLGEKGDQVAPLFITVDPERDTPAVLKDFLSNFDKRIIGLTGTSAQVKQVADEYKVYYAKSIADSDGKEKDKKDDDYNVDHSGYIYLMSKQGKFLRVFPYNVPEQELAHAIESALR